ncbi:unnamed protein product, partial [Ectocarpus sp. 12 AP-2014]
MRVERGFRRRWPTERATVLTPTLLKPGIVSRAAVQAGWTWAGEVVRGSQLVCNNYCERKLHFLAMGEHDSSTETRRNHNDSMSHPSKPKADNQTLRSKSTGKSHQRRF